MIYVASPYSNPSADVRYRRFREVCRYTATLMQAGNLAFSPIAHSHPIAILGEIQTDYHTWSLWCLRMIAACDIVYVLALPGWQNSVGVMAEIREAKRLGLSVMFVDPHNYCEAFVNPEDINAAE